MNNPYCYKLYLFFATLCLALLVLGVIKTGAFFLLYFVGESNIEGQQEYPIKV